MANSHLVRPKNKTDQKNNWIVGQIWLGILLYLPLFYQICPVGSTLLGQTAIHAYCQLYYPIAHFYISLRRLSYVTMREM